MMPTETLPALPDLRCLVRGAVHRIFRCLLAFGVLLVIATMIAKL